MMRINLLPPEILERRRAERRIGWVILGAVGVAVVLAGVWTVSYFRVQGRQAELAELQQQVQSTNAQATQLAIFEQRATELEARRTLVGLALGDRRDWAKLFDEVSLVLPADVWVQALTAGEGEGVSISGYALDAPDDSPDVGHKSIAKVLVRLADLDNLYDVWLTSSVKAEYEERPVIQFSITSKVVAPAAPAPAAATVGAPAEAGAQ
ncbi:MAG: PilN domain-containing protein [Coriobacteriia bacterium]